MYMDLMLEGIFGGEIFMWAMETLKWVVPFIIAIVIFVVLMMSLVMGKSVKKTAKTFSVLFFVGMVVFMLLLINVVIGKNGGDMAGIGLVFSGWIIFGILDLITLGVFLYERKKIKNCRYN